MRQDMNEIVKGGLMAGTISAIISFLLNYYLLPFPKTPLYNAVGHGIGGSLFSKIALAQNSVYAATKFALAGFSEGLRRELKPFGIDVGLFLPGPMKTSFHQNKGEEALKIARFMPLDSQKVAVKLEKMIRRRKKQMTLPAWMMAAVKLRYR